MDSVLGAWALPASGRGVAAPEVTMAPPLASRFRGQRSCDEMQRCSCEFGSDMAVIATPTTEVLPAAAEAAPHQPDDIEYPEGHWIAQSVWHGDPVRLATTALHHHFRDREDVLVAMELVVYYRRGDTAACLQPDVQVVFGAGRGGDRGTYKVWEEEKAPDFVLEVASPSTAGNDAQYEAGEYAGIGVRSTGGWTRRGP